MATPKRLIGRYELADLVAESPGTTLWRASDPVLNRAVAVRLIAASDPRREELRATARAAAIVDDRRIVHVLDVIDTPDGGLAVVTEWITGRNLAEVARELVTAEAATEICLDVARALQSAHKAGIAHGRILPSSVIICDTGPRIRGLGIDAVLFGIWPEVAPARADLHGVGAVLHAMLTGRWPGEVPGQREPGEVDGLPVSSTSAGMRLTPARLVAGVPRLLDEFVACSLVDAAPPRGRNAYPDLATAIAALSVAVRTTRPSPPLPQRTVHPHQRSRRLGAMALALVGSVLLAGVGWLLMATGPAASKQVASPGNGRAVLFAPVVTKIAVPTVSAAGNTLPIVGISEFNPFGHSAESTDPVTRAVDADPASAWHTATYVTTTLDGKAGVGLLLDLGISRSVSAVDLVLVGNGTDLQLLASTSIPTDPSTMNLVLKVAGAGAQIELRAPTPVTARYLVVWLTKLPVAAQGYGGGIAEIAVHG